MTFSLTAVKAAISAGFQRRQRRNTELQTKIEQLKNSQSAQRISELQAEVDRLTAEVTAEKHAKREVHAARQQAEDRANAAESALMELKGLAEADIPEPDAISTVSRETPPAPAPAEIPDDEPEVEAVPTPEVAE